MTAADGSSLSLPHVRQELIAYLVELEEDDPRIIWSTEHEQGLVCGIDEIFHFFFDDHDFDEGDVGRSLLNEQEVAAITDLKLRLDAVFTAVGDVGDDAFIEHPAWSEVRQAAAVARQRLHLAN